jgi:Tfp pilus assembly protein PilF
MRSQWDRRVVPRWRSSSVSASLLENRPLATANKVLIGVDDFLIKKVTDQIDDWRKDPSIGVAADLLNYSSHPNLRSFLVGPAEFLVNNFEDMTPQLRTLANRVLGQTEFELDKVDSSIRSEIRSLKTHLIMNPRNSIALIDIARLYSIEGQSEKALRAIKTAIALQPHHRFILRSATRFFLHNNSPDIALAILKRTHKVQEDPWLLASLIAVETILERPPIYFKKAKSMVENGRFSSYHVAELGAGLATLEANSGNIKNAKKLFNASLSRPNDNAVAQAVWASNEFSMPINIDPNWLTDRFSAEANYYTKEQTGDYDAALCAALDWFRDEPFSTRPLQASAFAASIVGNLNLAEEQTRRALKLDQTNIEVKNNLIFALLGQNKLQGAAKLLNEITHEELRKENGLSGHTLANIGMYFYRNNLNERGREFYERAFSLLDAKKENSSKALAMSYFAQEAILANDPMASTIMQRAIDIVKTSNSTAAKIVLERSTNDEVVISNSKDLVRSSVILEHDKVNNILMVSKKEAFGNRLKK